MKPHSLRDSSAEPVALTTLSQAVRRLAWLLLFAPFFAWGVFALYYGSWPRAVCVALALLYGAAHLAVLLLAPLRRVALGCMAAFLLPLCAFHLMQPCNDRVWQPDVAQLPYADIRGDQITVHNVRTCTYQSETNFTAAFETRQYDLSKLRTADIFLADWGLHKVAHTMLSFGFDDGQYLCFSIETRKEADECYSAFKGLFRQYEVIFIAGDERDLIRLRTHYRQGETVRLYRMVRATPEAIRGTFMDYMGRINSLKNKPEWYNALTENCMVGFFQIARQHAVKGRGRWHWSVILNGYADQHAYENGALDTTLPFEELRARSIINDRARAAGDSPAFSALIRQGLPGVKSSLKGGE
jgi:hypothetical protein